MQNVDYDDIEPDYRRSDGDRVKFASADNLESAAGILAIQLRDLGYSYKLNLLSDKGDDKADILNIVYDMIEQRHKDIVFKEHQELLVKRCKHDVQIAENGKQRLMGSLQAVERREATLENKIRASEVSIRKDKTRLEAEVTRLAKKCAGLERKIVQQQKQQVKAQREYSDLQDRLRKYVTQAKEPAFDRSRAARQSALTGGLRGMKDGRMSVTSVASLQSVHSGDTTDITQMIASAYNARNEELDHENNYLRQRIDYLEKCIDSQSGSSISQSGQGVAVGALSDRARAGNNAGNGDVVLRDDSDVEEDDDDVLNEGDIAQHQTSELCDIVTGRYGPLHSKLRTTQQLFNICQTTALQIIQGNGYDGDRGKNLLDVCKCLIKMNKLLVQYDKTLSYCRSSFSHIYNTEQKQLCQYEDKCMELGNVRAAVELCQRHMKIVQANVGDMCSITVTDDNASIEQDIKTAHESLTELEQQVGAAKRVGYELGDSLNTVRHLNKAVRSMDTYVHRHIQLSNALSQLHNNTIPQQNSLFTQCFPIISRRSSTISSAKEQQSGGAVGNAGTTGMHSSRSSDLQHHPSASARQSGSLKQQPQGAAPSSLHNRQAATASQLHPSSADFVQAGRSSSRRASARASAEFGVRAPTAQADVAQPAIVNAAGDSEVAGQVSVSGVRGGEAGSELLSPKQTSSLPSARGKPSSAYNVRADGTCIDADVARESSRLNLRRGSGAGVGGAGSVLNAGSLLGGSSGVGREGRRGEPAGDRSGAWGWKASADDIVNQLSAPSNKAEASKPVHQSSGAGKQTKQRGSSSKGDVVEQGVAAGIHDTADSISSTIKQSNKRSSVLSKLRVNRDESASAVDDGQPTGVSSLTSPNTSAMLSPDGSSSSKKKSTLDLLKNLKKSVGRSKKHDTWA